MTTRPSSWHDLTSGRPATSLAILNLTPDSFSDGGHFLEPEAALAQARSLVAAGAAMLDLGAESTRPGAEPVSEVEEWRRLEPVIAALRLERPGTPLSLDTRHAAVAEKGLAAGVAVLNDVTGFQDPGMLALARSAACPVIAMRCRTRDGQLWMPPYDGPGEEIAAKALAELRALRDRLLGSGIAPERLVLDPGFGFGTTWTEDKALWELLPDLPRVLDWPVERLCIAISRKRFTAWMAGNPALPPLERDGITAELHRQAAGWGYRCFRTHAVG